MNISQRHGYPPWLFHTPVDATFDLDDSNGMHRTIVETINIHLIRGNYRSIIPIFQSCKTDLKFFPVLADILAVSLWNKIDEIRNTAKDKVCKSYLKLAVVVLPIRAKLHVLRYFSRHKSGPIRFLVSELAQGNLPKGLKQLPVKKDSPDDYQSWFLAKKEIPEVPFALPLVPNISTVGELRSFLEIKSEKALGFLLLSCAAKDKQRGPYRIHTIPKRDGTDRVICAPDHVLKRIQRKILDEIVGKVDVHSAAHGFVSGRSISTNASPHVGQSVVVRFDLKNFFPTVSYARVRGLFSSLGYPGTGTKFFADDSSNQVAQVLARLCCYCENPKSWGGGALPQGSPASPAIANLVCRKLDNRLSGMCRKLGANYTRYADDLTISFSDPAAPIGRLKWCVDQIVHQEGFLINHEKFRVIRAGHRQIVTGVNVNDVPRAPKEVRRWLRAVIHNCAKHGVASQAQKYAELEGGRAEDFVPHIRGLAAYTHMVAPDTPGDLLAETLRVTENYSDLDLDNNNGK